MTIMSLCLLIIVIVNPKPKGQLTNPAYLGDLYKGECDYNV